MAVRGLTRQRLAKRENQLSAAFETHPKYYAANTQPAYSMFGAPDFVDENGREYRLAFSIGDGRDSATLALLRMRADASGQHVDATLDDLVVRLYRDAEADNRAEGFGLQFVSPGTTGRVRLWIRLPTRRNAHKETTLMWPEPSHELATRLVYIGDPSLGDSDARPVVVDVIIQNSQRSDVRRKTGFVDVTGISDELAAALLKRRIRILTGQR